MELQEIAALVDEYDEIRDHRLSVDKQAAYLKRQENELSDRLITILYDNEMMYVAGKYKRVKLNITSVPKAEDWDVIYEYMKEKDAMDLVQKRLVASAINDRIEEGEEIPGIVFVQINKLSIGKI